jgi:hypothetical protein
VGRPGQCPEITKAPDLDALLQLLAENESFSGRYWKRVGLMTSREETSNHAVRDGVRKHNGGEERELLPQRHLHWFIAIDTAIDGALNRDGRRWVFTA